MIYLFLVFVLLNCLFYLALAFGWGQIAETSAKTGSTRISIIIPVRNEEQVIEKLLRCLEHQEYDKDKFEVLVIDDFSEDGTAGVVQKCIEELSMDLRLIHLENQQESGKKRALTKGVGNARYDFILTTDADCQMGPFWLASFSAHIDHHKFIAGPVALKGQGLFSSLQQVEFSGLIGFGAVTMESNSPSMCSGANLGFDKEAFFAVGGYTNNLNIPSGDDEFLLYNIEKQFPGKTSFLKNRYAIVISETHTSLKGFINQRVRWTSKWRYNKNLRLRLMAVWFFMDHSLFALAIGLLVAGQLPPWLVAVIFPARFFANLLFILPIQRFIGVRSTVLPVLLIQIIYPFHVIFMGVNSIFGHYTWKGRKY